MLFSPLIAHARPVQLQDFRRVVALTDPELSPDGKSVAVLVLRPDFDKDGYDRSLVLVDVATGSQRTLTYQREGLGSERWSPSGDRLAFLARAGTDEAAREQIFVMPMNGGDPVQITHAANGVQQFAWRPDGNAVAYVTSDAPPDKAAIDKHNDGFVVGDNTYLQRAESTPSHIWIVNADGSGDHRLTSGSWSLPTSEPPGPPGSPLSWSPDGKWLAVTRLVDPIYGDNDHSYVVAVDASSGEQRKLTSHAMYESFPVVSPDGSKIAYWYPRDGDPVNTNSVWVAPASGGDGTEVTHALDRNIVRALWMPDGQSLLVAAHDATMAAMWIQPLNGSAKRIDTGDICPSEGYWLDASVGPGGAIAFVGSQTKHPSELWYLSSPDAKPKQLTTYNDAFSSLDFGAQQELDWQSPDGFAEDGVLVYPPGFVAAKKYPLVLYIHGGPNSASVRSFAALPQLLAARGWLVFEPNYRGSDNLGNAYWRAIVNDAGDGPGKDVMAGIAAVERLGIVDQSHMAVSGWSYGGYMTSWMETHYDIWKAAVAGAAVNNWVDEYDLSDNNVSVRYEFAGYASPWTTGMASYKEQSPLTYARDVKAPTLILSDLADSRVPVTQSFEMYHALKDNGVTTEFWEYPVAGHSPGDPVRIEDIYRRWIDWLARYLP
jgi:dipeptidyl aminopeptidase/acylaminoacyl peptidase